MHLCKKITIIVTTTVISLLCLAAPVSVQALFENAKEDACKGVQLSNTTPTGSCVAGSKEAETKLNSTLATAINLFSLFIAVVAVITIMIGGLRYITANGDAGNLTNARNTILYALIGLIIAAFAQIIVKFVLQRTSQ